MQRSARPVRARRPAPPPDYHRLSAAETCARLGTDAERGLGLPVAAARLRELGPNRLAGAARAPLWRRLVAQLDDFMNLVLLGAAACSLLLGEYPDGLAVLVIVITNAALGFAQESRAERALDALRRLTAPAARVARDGREVRVPADEVVPGDLLLLEAGDRVAADARLVEAASLAVEEAALTGESRPVAKSVEPLVGPASAPADRVNMLHLGTHVVRGRGRAVVTATGMGTEVGRIAGLMLEAGEGLTPLQRRLDALGRWLVIGCLAISLLVVSVGVLQGEAPYRMFLAGVSLAVAAIPEGLPAIVTIALALGVQRMIARHAVVRRLPAVETLGCATVVCADKTGTLTQNLMAVQVVAAAGRRYRVEPDGIAAEGGASGPGCDAALRACVEVAALCNNAAADRNAPGADPTEVALCDLAVAAGISPRALAELHPRRAEVPFESERRRMSVVVEGPSGPRVLVKGALEDLLARASFVAGPQGPEPCDARRAARLRAEAEAMAGAALRVLAFAARPAPANWRTASPEALESGLTVWGLAGMWDPPRPEVPAAVRRCHQAGIRAVMITGDHASTARAIAARIGLLPPGGRVVTGAELEALSDAALGEVAAAASVYARVSPAQKLRIVRALRARGDVVAMTGDGVNDAPAVKEADIGIAMGRGGTDVTREASALVLMDDNFATIVAAIEEGRAIYDNIRKFIRYLLACNTGEVLVMLAGTLLGLPLPLLPLQLLLVNLVTDGLPAMALGLDPAAPDLMRRPPRDPRESAFAGGLGKRIALRGFLIGGLSLGLFIGVLASGAPVAVARTAATCTLVLSQLLHAFDARTERGSLLQTGFGGNRALQLATLSSLLILLCAVYVPWARDLVGLRPLGPGVWLAVVGAAAAGAVLAGLAEGLGRIWARRTSVVAVRSRRAPSPPIRLPGAGGARGGGVRP